MKHIQTFESFLNESNDVEALNENVRRITKDEIKPGTRFVWYSHSDKEDEMEITEVTPNEVAVMTLDKNKREYTVKRPDFDKAALILL